MLFLKVKLMRSYFKFDSKKHIYCREHLFLKVMWFYEVKLSKDQTTDTIFFGFYSNWHHHHL